MNDTPHTIKCIELNPNSLNSKAKQHELNEFVKQHKPDVLFMVETKLKPNKKMSILNYNLFRNDRSTDAGGGTAILIKNRFVSTHLKCIPSIVSFEYTAIKIALENNSQLYFVAIYKKPTNKIDTSELSKLIDSFNGTPFVLAGDFNCKHSLWGNSVNNSEGNRLYNWLCNTIDNHNHNLNLLKTEGPTCIRPNSESYLDLFIIDDSLRVVFEPNKNNLSTLEFDSDHRAVSLKLSLINKEICAEPKKIYNYEKADFENMCEFVDRKLNEIRLPISVNIENDQIDKAILQLNEIFEAAINKYIPVLEIKTNTLIKLSQKSLKLIQEKKRARRRYFRNKGGPFANLLKSQVKLLTNMTYNSIVSDYKAFWERKFGELKADKNIFRHFKRFSNYKKHIELPDTMYEDENSTIQIDSDVEKANAFAEHFKKSHNLTLNMGDNEFSSNVNNYIKETFDGGCITDFSLSDQNEIIQNNEQSHFVDAADVEAAIKSRNTKKSFGNDGISNFILRKIATGDFCKYIAILFNHIINNSYMPKQWKEAIIVPLPKPNKNNKLICYYRPISKLSCLAKVLEKIQATKLEKECVELGVSFDGQFGFRPGLTTSHALFKISSQIAIGLNNNTPSHLIALDFEKAYDTLWIEGLVFKLHKMLKFSKPMCSFILNYLTNRTYRVQVKNSLSDAYSAPAGTAQGSTISCLLYILYVIDFPKNSGSLHTTTTQFADDVLITVQTKLTDLAEVELNNYLNEINDYLKRWKIKVNPQKCEETTILGNIKQTTQLVRSRAKAITLQIENNLIPKTDKLKYLGINFTRNFKFNSHVDTVRTKMLASYFALKNIFFNKKIDKKLKLLAYKQIIKPIAMYAAPIWLQVSKNQINKIALIERKILRACSGRYRHPNNVKYYSNDTLYAECALKPIETELICSTLKFFEKIKDNNPANLIHYLVYDEDSMNSLHYYHSKPPAYIEYLNDMGGLFVNENQIYYDSLPTIDQYRLGFLTTGTD